MRAFNNPGLSLGDLDAKAAAAVVMAVADIALVIGGDGVIRDLSVSNPDLLLALEDCRGWEGRPWRDLVTMDSRSKLDGMLSDVVDGVASRWRHMNHPAVDGGDVPVLYTAVRFGADGRILAVGRDLRSVANLQQRLVDAQQSMDQDSQRLQHLELRYRLLFQTAREAIVIVDAGTHRLLEANPAAYRLLGDQAKRMVGRPLTEALAPDGMGDVQGLLNAVRASGRPDETRVRMAESGTEMLLVAHMFRQDSQSLFLVRLCDPSSGAAVTPREAEDRPELRTLLEHAPDAFIVTAADARVTYVNTAFLELAQLSNPEQALGEPLDRWLGQPGVDVGVLITNLKQRGSIRLFSTTLRGEHGIRSDVEVSAVAVTHGRHPLYGFTVRNVARRWNREPGSPKAVARTPDQLTELIGRVPLKDLVRESTDVIERLCIEAALELTGNNRASAAEMLGLSRQSLYVKLRRFGIADAEENADV